MLSEFVKIPYCLLVPLMLAWSFLGQKRYAWMALRLLAVLNLIFILNAVFLGRQFLGFYSLAMHLGLKVPQQETDYWLTIKTVLLLCLPFFSLLKPVRSNRLYSLVLWGLAIDFHRPTTWHFFGISQKLMMFFCLFCSVYALLWLLKQLPYQSRHS